MVLPPDEDPAVNPGSSSIPNNSPTKASPWSVQSVLANLPRHVSYPQQTSSPIPFFHLLERLKTEKREGWRRFDISQGESIADHMYRMSIITMLAPPTLSSRLNIPHCTQMALVHDMAEALVGDITPVDGVPKTEKNRREATTMDYICDNLLGGVHDGSQAKQIRAIWQEYEDSETPESKFVHDVDKVELILQMVDYERSSDGAVDLSEFSWVARKIELPEMQEWAKQVLDERAAFWKEKGRQPGQLGKEEGDKIREAQEEYYGNGNSKDTVG